MKAYQYFTITMIVILAIALVPGGVVQAFPPIPSSFYGSVKLNGGNLPAGTTIQALINGEVFATSTIELYQGDSVYSLTVPGDDLGTAEVEGGHEGSVISFEINGELADQTATWHSGTNVSLDLTFTTNSNLPTSTPTSAPQVTQTVTSPAVTPTQIHEQELTRTDQPITSTIPMLTETLQGSKEEVFSRATDDYQIEPSENPSLTPASGVGSGSENSDHSSPDRKSAQEEHKIWISIGIAVVGLVGIGLGARYLIKRSKTDHDLL